MYLYLKIKNNMAKTLKQKRGNIGEDEVVKHFSCPNCGKPLMKLPAGYPIYDVQCTACAFRAQVKSANSKPKNEIFGAGWDIMEKTLKAGYLPPALIVNFKWTEERTKKHRILFFPFVPKSHLKRYKLSSTSRQANYKMFNYIKLLSLPHFIKDVK